MKVSLNTIKQYTSVDLPVDELVHKINQQLGGVEQVVDLGAKYRDAVIVKVVTSEKHPNADKLSVCQIDAGDSELFATYRLPSTNLIQVVCGAPNVHADMFAIWLPPKSTVPATFDTAEPFVLTPKEIRGVISNGMLAASDELGIGSDHGGIIELTESDLSPYSNSQKLIAGLSFAETFGLDDVIIDIENKMFTHRPDLFGQLGVAREIAGIQHQKFTSPLWYATMPDFATGKGLDLEVSNQAGDKVPRFMAVAIGGISVKPSPLWLQCALVAMGSKPINNIVDVTNYIMLLTAQPIHAYDYDKLRGHALGVRMADDGEKLTLLNGRTYELSADDIVIVDGEGPVGMGGVMGGGNSEVSVDTKNIVLEVANFDMYAVRKTSMRHGLFTEAVTRFNKGQSALQNPYVLAQAMAYILQVAGGDLASGVFDEKLAVSYERKDTYVSLSQVNQLLGLKLSGDEVVELLANVEFEFVEPIDDTLRFKIPFWRTDIAWGGHDKSDPINAVATADLAEEVGRLYGFDKLPRELPTRSILPAPHNLRVVVKQAIRDSMLRAGANEVLTYSFVHENIMKRAEQDATQAFQLSNALSPELQYYRLSVLPSLLNHVHANIKAGYDEFTLYEIGKGHNKRDHATDDDGLPSELEFVDAIYVSKKPRSGAAYYHMRKQLVNLAADLGFTLKLKPITSELDFPVTAPFDLSRSALVETRDGTFIGMVGELKQTVVRNFKLPKYSAAMTLDLSGLETAYETPRQTYTPLSKYPSVTQDISLRVAASVSYEEVFWTVWQALAEVQPENSLPTLSPLSIYQPDDDLGYKTVTIRLQIASNDRTLTDGDVAGLLDHVAEVATKKIDAARV